MTQNEGEAGQAKQIRNFILSEPEIRVIELNPATDDFFLLASDGLYDRFSSKECCKVITQKLRKMDIMEQCVQNVAQEVVTMAKSKRMMTDNITLILVALNRGVEAKSKDKEKN